MGIVRFVNIVSAGLVTGAMAMELAVILPGLRTVPGRVLVEVHRELMPRASRYVPMLGALATIAGVVALFDHDFSDAATILTIAGLAAWIVAVLITYRVYLPLAVGVTAWKADAEPTTHDATMSRWFGVHAVRTAFFLGGFALFTAAALAR